MQAQQHTERSGLLHVIATEATPVRIAGVPIASTPMATQRSLSHALTVAGGASNSATLAAILAKAIRVTRNLNNIFAKAVRVTRNLNNIFAKAIRPTRTRITSVAKTACGPRCLFARDAAALRAPQIAAAMTVFNNPSLSCRAREKLGFLNTVTSPPWIWDMDEQILQALQSLHVPTARSRRFLHRLLQENRSVGLK